MYFIAGSVIGGSAFYGCTSLIFQASGNGKYTASADGKMLLNGTTVVVAPASSGTVIVPEGITSIGDYAFSGCISLASITLPDSLASIGNNAFRGCTSLIFQASGNGKYTASADGKMLLDGTTVVTALSVSGTVIVPEGITSIGDYAFYECRSLTSITLPDSLVSIGNNAFSGCTSLVLVTCNAVTPLSYIDLPYSVSIIKVPGSSVQAYKSAWTNYANRIAAINSVTQTFTSIAELSTFLSGAEEGYIYDIVLTGINIQTGMVSGSDPLGTLYAALNGKFVSLDLSGCQGLAIPGTSDSVAGYRQNKNTIVSITLPDSLTSIGEKVFYGCTSLASITLPDSLTSIGEKVFYGCTSLASITLPDTLASIGNEAFRGTSLASITLPDTLASIGNGAFRGTSLASITLPDSLTSIGDLAFSDCTSLASITLPDLLTSIGDNAFSGCTSLASITLPDSLTSIGDGAFYDCRLLASVTLPGSLTSIGHGAFYGCTSLTSVISNKTTPPGLSMGIIGVFSISTGNWNFLIKVPAASVAAYQAASGWREYADYIVALDN